jgi:hypothetical protein
VDLKKLISQSISPRSNFDETAPAGVRRKEAVEEEKKGGAQVLSPRLEVAMGWCSPKSSRRSLVIVNLGMALTGFVFLIVGGVSLHSGPPPALQPPFVSIRL